MKTNCKLSPLALGLSFGIVWAVSLFITGLMAYFYAYGRPFVLATGTVYMGYEPTILGSFLGAIIGFINAFIGGYIIAWLYNCFGGCRACHPVDDRPL